MKTTKNKWSIVACFECFQLLLPFFFSSNICWKGSEKRGTRMAHDCSLSFKMTPYYVSRVKTLRLSKPQNGIKDRNNNCMQLLFKLWFVCRIDCFHAFALYFREKKSSSFSLKKSWNMKHFELKWCQIASNQGLWTSFCNQLYEISKISTMKSILIYRFKL